MGVAKVILNGVTQMDVTQDTVLSTNLLTGYTAHAANGEVVTGAYEGGKDELALLLSGKLSSYSNSSLSTLVNYAFAYVSSLSFVYIPNISTIPTGCFADCLMLSSIVISSGASITIWPNAFSGCIRFSGDYSFFQKIKEVASYAFSGCRTITSAPFGSFLTHLGSCAFYNCTSLTDVDLTALSSFNGQITGASVFTGCQRLSLGTVLLSNNIRLGEATSVFANCGIASVDTYMEVSLSTLIAVGRNMFYGCGYLSKLHVDGMRYIPTGFATNCSRLNDIYFPSAEACIGGACFAYCSSLTKVTNDEFPLLVGLGSSMFLSCANLSIFSLSALNQGALTYGSYDHPLRNCSNLKRISAPTVTYPGSLPYIGLTALEHLTIGGYHITTHRKGFFRLSYFEIVYQPLIQALFTGIIC